jgi:hypothetical protein
VSKNQGAIDNAFLFLLTSLTLFFGLLNDAVGGRQAIVYQVPVVATAFFYPFYVGYVRGTITCSDTERLHGWILFAFGVVANVFILADILLLDYLPDWTPLSLLLAGVGSILSWRLISWVRNVIGISRSEEMTTSINLSCLSALFLASSVCLMWHFLYTSLAYHSVFGYSFVVLSVIIFLAFVLVEQTSGLSKKQNRVDKE